MIKLHSRQFYDVGAIGFAPGFAFLSAVDRLLLYLGIRPLDNMFLLVAWVLLINKLPFILKSPGGWHIIGNCPQSVFEAQSYPQSCFCHWR